VTKTRIQSIDLLRGIACVLMAIDHVRVYAGIPAGGPEPSIFLTRWVTHFVAPAFCFFAGTAAYFLGKQLGDTAALRRFLVSRGVLLVLLELTLIRFLWAFHWSPDFILAGVIWMLGSCMVLLAAFVGMPAKRVGAIGVGIVLLQQLFGLVPSLLPEGARASFGLFWNFIYPAGTEPWQAVQILYVIVPWIGVMMAGYGLGLLWERTAEERDKLFVRIGASMTLLFLIAAAAIALSSPTEGDAAPLWMRLLNQQKYPASQLFLLMTLGPAIAALPWAERARGWLARAFVTTGRVPMFYYLAHLLVIHSLALLTMRIHFDDFDSGVYNTAPYAWLPDHRWPLWMLYVNWAVASVILYVLCRWYAERKATRPAAWMRYL
jgi:uncharacterized membrane protein